MEVKVYDEKCYELAQSFLTEIVGSTDKDIVALAQAIQNVIEDACDEIEQRETKQ